MTIGLLGAVLIAALCVLLSAFFAGSETAVAATDHGEMRRRAAGGDVGAVFLLRFYDHPQRLLVTTIVASTLSMVVATLAVTAALRAAGSQHVSLLAIACLPPAFLLLGEVIPTSLFRRHADRVSPRIAPVLWTVSVLLRPLSAGLEAVVNWVARQGGERQVGAPVSREELLLLLEAPAAKSGITEGERRMISRIFDFGETAVADVMLPLSEVFAMSEDATLEEIVRELHEEQHTRIPIYRDRVDQIVGVVHAFDVLCAQGDALQAADIARPPKFVPGGKPAVDLLIELQREGRNLAVVVDEYGGAVGIVTIEDILEEIVGEIDDEFDTRPPLLRAEAPGVYRVSGRMLVGKLNAALHTDLPEGEEYETVAGLLLARLTRIPQVGETLRLGSAALTVVSANERAIEEVRVRVSKRA